MDAQEKEKKLKLMKFWLFGTFGIVFAAFTVYFGGLVAVVGGATGFDASIFASANYWLFIAVTAILCVGVWYGYKSYLNKK